jgi:hypothetical protein
MAAMFDPFMILGISPETATFDDARARYRNLVKSHHPDVSGGDLTLMTRITQAWRSISTPDALQERARAVLARRQPPVKAPRPDAHAHDVRTSDGIIHLGPFTRGTCHREAESHVKDLIRKSRSFSLKGLLKGCLTAPRCDFTAPTIQVPHAFSLTHDRLYFFVDGPVAPGPTLLCVPAMRRDEAGGIGYSGAAARVMEVDIPEGFTGLMGLGQSVVRGGTPFDAALVVEEL